MSVAAVEPIDVDEFDVAAATDDPAARCRGRTGDGACDRSDDRVIERPIGKRTLLREEVVVLTKECARNSGAATPTELEQRAERMPCRAPSQTSRVVS